MHRHSRFSGPVAGALALILGMVPAVALAADGVSAVPSPTAVVAPTAVDLGDATRFVVVFGAKADLDPASSVEEFRARGKAVLEALQSTATSAQAEALAVVQRNGGTAQSFWIRNTIVVEGDQALADTLAALPGVAEVRPEQIYPLIEPVKPDELDAVIAAAEPEWNVAKIGADVAWAQGVLGGGIVVGGLDTGVDVEHPALINQYRGNLGDGTIVHDYNWFDPSGVCGDVPCDNVGHGTHTMGTIVGGDGPGPFAPDIGVAPGARWIAAKGCEDFGCSESALLAAGQFMLAPTDLLGENPDPSKRPDIVSNSWGGGPGDPFYQDIVSAWRASGIIPVFASGNPGPGCGDGGSPGDYPEAISVGATDIDDVIADFSGRGPSVFGKTNPNVSAPGVDVISSVPGGGYESFSGTSMATPAVAGTLALMLSASPELIGDPAAAQSALEATALDIVDLTCGGDADGDPNNVYGEGRIDAATAVDLVANGGTLEGTITDANGGAPLAGARVSASNDVREFSTITDEEGHYRLLLAEDTYVVNASVFGYETAVVAGVELVSDATTIQDVALTRLPRFRVRGRVLAAETGASVRRAVVTVLGTPVPPVTTDSVGYFDVVLPLGNYTFGARAGGCTQPGRLDVEVTRPRFIRIRTSRKIDDFGHGCRPIGAGWTPMEAQTDLFGDDSYGRLRLPFEFPYYDQSFGSVFVSTNGFLSFEDPIITWIGPGAIPTQALPNNAIYPLWSDLFLGEDSTAGYNTGGTAPRRWFTVSFEGVTQFGGGSSTTDFQVRLWENGTIDMIYRDNAGAPGDGSTATVGLESPDGSDGFPFSFREAVIAPNGAYRFEVVPTGVVSGTVTNRNDGLPVAGATVTAEPGGRTATTDADGNYRLRLVPGRYTLTSSAGNHVNETVRVRIRARSTPTINFSLAAAQLAVAPSEIAATTELGETTTRVVTVSNTGTAPLEFEVRERDETAPTPPPEPPIGPDGAAIVRSSTWGPFALPAGTTGASADASLTFDGPLELIVDDPDDDAVAAPELTKILAGADDVEASIQLDFAAPPTQLGGYFFIDADQDTTTGLPPEALFGLPTQDVGVDYFVDLFGVGDGVAYLVDTNTFELIAVLAAVVDGNSVRFDLPLDAMTGVEGAIDIATVLGNFFEPTDWGPDVGKGTVEPFRDAPWMSAEPGSGTLAPGTSTDVEVTLGGVDPGDYSGQLVVQANDPRQRSMSVDASLTVVLPDGFGSVSGTITNARTGSPIPATVEVEAKRDGNPYPIVRTVDDSGALTLYGPIGTWPVTVSSDDYEPFEGEVTIPDGTPGTFDAALRPMWPEATLDGGPLAFAVPAGGSSEATLTLGNVDGLADLTFTVRELAGAIGAVSPTVRPTTSAEPSASGGIEVDAVIQGSPVLILQDDLPWGVTSIQDVLDLVGEPYDIAGSAELPDLELGGYGLVIVANDQPLDFYTTLSDQMDRLASFVEGGGFLWLGVAGWGSYDGGPGGLALPGSGTVIGPVYEDSNAVTAPDHPLAAGLPDPFNGTAASHATIEGTPDGTVIATTPGGDPTLVEYPLGAGRVVVVGQPVEFGWAFGQDAGMILENGMPYALGFEPFTDVPWLDIAPAGGTVAPGTDLDLAVTVSAADLEPGSYEATIVVTTDDRLSPRFAVPVAFTVEAVGPSAGTETAATSSVTSFATFVR